jgi:hypothetical protein
MLSAVGRSEDTVRGRRSQRDDATENEESLVILESSFSSTTSNTSGPSSHEDEVLTTKKINTDVKATNTTAKSIVAPRQLTQEETIDLTRRAVENGIQETKRSLAGDDSVSEVVRPKLTIDLGHSHIVRIPEQVVDIIKDEVERYVLPMPPSWCCRCSGILGNFVSKKKKKKKRDARPVHMLTVWQTITLKQSFISYPLSLCGMCSPSIP